mmetsp:Transcript_8871/g.15624  ORF Transcript_8871/g.15624 Transcript_8871/m.15624 type:complete len:303 (+) Transcript_8871:107-1015(+)
MALVATFGGESGQGEEVKVYQLLSGRDLAKDFRKNQVHRFAVQMANYMYLVVCGTSAVAVDPAWDIDGLLVLCANLGVSLERAVYTHAHFDHTGGRVPRSLSGAKEDIQLPGVAELIAKGVTCFVGREDVPTVLKQSHLKDTDVQALDHKNKVPVNNNVTLLTLLTPGHTPGSACFLLDRLLFTGDTLFIGSCGRVDLPESSPSDMLTSLATLADLPSDTMVLPGHNYAFEAHTTIGDERSTNYMMMQAIDRVNSNGNAVSTNPVISMLPLPDYLGVARTLARQTERHHHDVKAAKSIESRF